MRKLWVAVAAGVAVVGLAATGFVLLQPPSTPAKEEPPERATAEVVRGDLAEQTLVQGSLAHIGERTIAGGEGTLTSFAAAGTTVGAGEQLFSVDNIPTVLFTGALPQWRSFELGMSRGPDVRQLEETLVALGYFWAEPDDVFDDNTRVGIRFWQDGTGREVTGDIGLGEIHFAPGPVRVAASELAVGAATAPGTAILRVTDLGKNVTVNLKLAQQKLAVVGAPVEVELPGGAKTPGTVTAVDPPREPKKPAEGGGESAPVIPVTVTLDAPDDAAAIDRAGVRVSFTSETREDVLSVPVGALLALPGGGYGLEVVRPGNTGTKQVPVETGLFAGGLVEISGEGIDAGTTVVVAES